MRTAVRALIKNGLETIIVLVLPFIDLSSGVAHYVKKSIDLSHVLGYLDLKIEAAWYAKSRIMHLIEQSI
ncbi:MAG TPA: hypothetical protein VJ250_07530 [Nitrososphaeraceae archaeon]|nr:hypothetical protein [Nitrososphaeraceae archaeon]